MKTSLVTLILLLLLAADSLAGVLRVGAWSSWGTTPHSSLTAALAAAQPGDEVWVVSNTYREAELTIPVGVSVYGGFTGSETSLSERNYATNVTILDGSGAHRVATVSGLLDGFTLRNGRTGDNGGGALVRNGGTISHCVLFKNEAGYDGGAVFAEDGGTITNSLFTGNRAGNDGAAVSGTAGYRAMNLTVADNLLTGMPVVDALTGVPASLQAGGVLNVAPPAISDDGGSTVLMKGWEFDGNAISMPYTVTYADNGKMLRYWAANAVGVGVSAEVALKIEWVATFRESLRTPIAVCEGTTLADAGLVTPAFGVEPGADAGTVTRDYYFLGAGGADTKLSGLDYALQYTDNNKLLVCRVYKDGVLSAETPAVRVAVMKAPQILLTPAPLSAEDGERLCLPAAVVLSNGSDVTAQGWHWKKGDDGGDFTSCDVVDKATLDGATLYYTATNACSDPTPVSVEYATLSVAEAVGEFSLRVDEICSGMALGDCISFADGGRADGVYTIGGVEVTDFATRVLTEADNLKQLKYTYNGGKNERRLTLTVHSVPTIKTQPVSPADAICKGFGHSLNVVVSGESLRYQWEESADHGTTWLPVAGATDSYLRLNVENNRQYHCTVTGVCISKSAGYDNVNKQIVSSAATIAVTDRPVIGLPTLTDFDICEQATLGSILAGSGVLIDGVAAVPDNGTQGWTLGGIKVPTTYPVTASDDGKVLGYWASNGCGETVGTFPVTIQVDDNPVIVQDPQDAEVQMGSNVRLSLRATGSGTLAYQWQKKAAGDADFTAVTDGGTFSGATTNTLSFIAAAITDITVNEMKTQYRCVVTTNNVCLSSVTSTISTVTVRRTKGNISILSQPQGYEICKGSDFQDLAVEVSGTGKFYYEWYRSDGTVVKAKDADPTVNPTDIYRPDAAGNYYCIVTGTDDATGVRTQQAIVTEYQTPFEVTVSPDNSSVCEGNTVTLGVSMAKGDSPVYQWYSKTAAAGGATGGTLCAGATSSTFTLFNLTANGDGSAKDYYYYCEVVSKYCPGTKVFSSLVAVKVNKSPKISVQPKSQTICQDDVAALSVTAVTDKTDGYTWYLNDVAQAGTSNTFNATKAGVYTCEVSSEQCGSVFSALALVTVAATPGITLAATDGGNLTACKGDMVVLPSPLIDARGSVILTDKSGWYMADDPTKLISSYVVSKEEMWTYKLMYKCSEEAEDEKTYGDGDVDATAALSLTVKMTPVPTITGSLKAAALTVNAGDQIIEVSADAKVNSLLAAALTVENATGYEWLLGGVPVTLPYTVGASDNGKSFEVRARNACGGEVYLQKDDSRAKTTLTVNSLAITTQPVSQAYCSGVTDKTLTVATNITEGVSYQWYKNGIALTSAPDVANGSQDATLNLEGATTDAGVYTCEVKLGSLAVLSSPAVVTVVQAPVVNLTATEVTYCPDDEVTLPTPSIETNGSVIDPANSGWTTTADGTTLTGTVKAPATADGSQAYYYRIQYTCGSSAKAWATSVETVTVKSVANPPTPTFIAGATAATTCDGVIVALPTVTPGEGTRTGGEWVLYSDNTATIGRSKGDITEYKVSVADNGKVFRYVNVNRCGVKSTSTQDYTLNVMQPAKITSKLAWPVVIQAGEALSTVVSDPTADNVVSEDWILNTTSIELSNPVALTDDGGKLTYRVANGCSTIGSGFGAVDETSTLLRVWDEPKFTGDGVDVPVCGEVGKPYTFPVAPRFNLYNCTLVSEGWVLDGGDIYINVAQSADLADDGKKIKYQVEYWKPGESSTTKVQSNEMGTLRPWVAPTFDSPVSGDCRAKLGTEWDFSCEGSDGINTKIIGRGFILNGEAIGEKVPTADRSQERASLLQLLTFLTPDGVVHGIAMNARLMPWGGYLDVSMGTFSATISMNTIGVTIQRLGLISDLHKEETNFYNPLSDKSYVTARSVDRGRVFIVFEGTDTLIPGGEAHFKKGNTRIEL